MVKSNGEQERKWFALAGCFLTLQEHYRNLSQQFDKIKTAYFRHHSTDCPVILHRIDMCCPSPRGAFSVLRDESKRERFYEDLLAVIENCDFKVMFAISEISPYAEAKKTDWRTLRYRDCLELLLERYCDYLNREGYQGDVMASHLGLKENRILHVKYWETYQDGGRGKFASFYRRSLSSSALKIEQKQKNVAGLQLADLFAAPIVRTFLSERTGTNDNKEGFAREIVEIISPKVTHGELLQH
jgi:hypothetical protein